MVSRRKPDEIEQQLERTRVEMDDTMRAIVEKVAPREWLEETFRYFADSSSEYVQSLGRGIMRNPLPLALTGIGFSWLILAGRSSSPFTEVRKRNSDPMKERYGQPMEKMQDVSGRLRESLGRMVDPLRRRAEEGAKGFRHRLEGAEGSQSAGIVRARGRKLRENIRTAMQEQPLAVGVLVFSIGAAVGAILPLRRESGGMGERGLAERVQEMARETGGAEEAGVEIQFAGGEEERSAENVSAL